MLLCTTLTPLKQAARKLTVQSIPPALRVKFTFYCDSIMDISISGLGEFVPFEFKDNLSVSMV